MNRLTTSFKAVGLAGLMTLGCSSGDKDPAVFDKNPVSGHAPADPNFGYTDKPSENFSTGSCFDNPEGWASSIDMDPTDQEDYTTTIGFSDQSDAEGYPFMSSGATIQGLGEFVYQISTSNNPDSSVTVDLYNNDYSELIDSHEAGYDAVFTARLASDGSTYFRLDCLPEFNFYGNQPSEPSDKEPVTIPAGGLPD